MFIPIWVIYLVVVLALVVVPVFMVFSIRRNTNALIKKLDDRFEKMSLTLKNYVNINEKKTSNSVVIEDNNKSILPTIFFGYISDLGKCIVFSGGVIVIMYYSIAKFKPPIYIENTILFCSLLLIFSSLLFLGYEKSYEIVQLFKRKKYGAIIFAIVFFIFSVIYLGATFGMLINHNAKILLEFSPV